MKSIFTFVGLCLSLLLCLDAARAFSPTDVVPRGSALYQAVALLAEERLLAAGAPTVNDLQGVTGRLYTRSEFARLVDGVIEEPADPRARAALDFAREVLGLRPLGGAHSTVGASGDVLPLFQGRHDTGGGLKSRGYLLGRGSVYGTIGRNGGYAATVSNDYRLFRDHASFTTHGGGREGGDSPDVLGGVDEAYATAANSYGLRVSAGLLRQRWGGGYRGDLLVGDNAPAHPALQVELPFSLGHVLGAYRFTQYEATFHNAGRTVYQGGRRLEHPVGDRVTVSLEEAYNSNQFTQPIVLILPYYAYQQHNIRNGIEPTIFNYVANAEVAVQATPDARVYGQFLLDDLESPKGIGRGNSVPRKIGYLLGYAQSLRASGTDVVIEFAHADRATYTDQYPELAWFASGLPQGHPGGPNGNEVFLRLGQRLSTRLDASLELRDRRRVTDDFPAPTDRALDFGLAYRIGTSRSLGLQFSEYHEDPFTGVSTSAPGTFGGASAGERLRRRILGVSFLQSF